MAEELNLLDGLDIAIPDGPANSNGSTGSTATFFGPYQILQDVGAGGVARVMRARHIHPHYADKMFAVKVLHPQLSQDPKVMSLFRREAYVLSLLKHPNVVQTFEAGAQENMLFIAMEYIDGRDLDNMMTRCQAAKLALPLALQLHIIGEVVKALTYAHNLADHDNNRLNLIHRDVNPANVFVSFDGRVKLGDFGVASITAGRVEKSRELAGKLGYFAPEQLAGDPVDQRADLFAVGVMMFELLCGVRLFEADDADQSLRLNKRAKIPKPTKFNPNIPAGVERIMIKALERKPADRFSGGAEMLEALRPFLPQHDGLTLAVASLMRRVFLNEHLQELTLQEGLAGRNTSRGSGQLITVFTPDERAKAAFAELLQSRGYRVQVHGGFNSLCDGVTKESPEVLLADVSEDFVPSNFNAAVKSGAANVPVIAISAGLDPESVERADQLHAVDLIFKPFSVERVMAAVRGALVRQVPQPEGHETTRRFTRLLLISNDTSTVERYTTALEEGGYVVDHVPNATEAMLSADRVSYQALVYDAHPASAADRLFVAQYRSVPGMSMVPVVFLVDESARAMFRGMLIDRTQVVRRRASPAEVLESLVSLRDDTRAGRTFLRYDTDFAAELRYGGRVFSCVAVNISRGGVSLECDHIPPVGTELNVTLRFDPLKPPLEVSGLVIRVNLVKSATHEAAQVGVEFHRFGGRGEGELITFIRMLEQGAGPEVLEQRVATLAHSR